MIDPAWPEPNAMPIVIFGGPDTEPLRVAGTGFLLGRGLFVTCWHCVAAELPEGRRYVASPADPGRGGHIAVPLLELGKDENGSDLALALVGNYQGDRPHFRLAAGQAPQGQQVWTYGYPLAEQRTDEAGRIITRVAGRLLKGYITMATISDEPGREGMSVYELDMHAPRGLSGAPVMLDNLQSGTRDVIGVVQGVHEVLQIEDMATRDPDTGEWLPERVQIVSFALALDTLTLQSARGAATGGLTVREFLQQYDPQALA